MKKIIAVILSALAISAVAKETILIQNGSAASQPNIATYMRTLEIANRMQNKYEFVLEMKPGANGALALRSMDLSPANRLATIAPAFVENSKQGLINEADYVPILAQGDACWAVITNVGDTRRGLSSLKGQKEITVGGTGYGNAAHITSIMLGEKYGFRVRYIVYKSNFDALVAMASQNDINFVIERISNYRTFKEKNPRLQVLGINCPNRNPLMPEVKTIKEQGFETPTIFFMIVANTKMSKERRDEISSILEEAQKTLGQKYMLDSADILSPQFSDPVISTVDFFNKRTSQMHYLTRKYREQIDEAKAK